MSNPLTTTTRPWTKEALLFFTTHGEGEEKKTWRLKVAPNGDYLDTDILVCIETGEEMSYPDLVAKYHVGKEKKQC